LNNEVNDIHCLYSIFNFAFGTNYIPSFLSKDKLVENYMMTIFEDIYEYIPENEEDDGHSNLIGGFLPEGVLNYLSARYFTKFPQSFTEMLNTSREIVL
jgi:hypothetical protein